MKTMKMIALLCLLSLIQGVVMAQVPDRIHYQGVARNTAGVAMANQALGLRFSFHTGTASGPVAYQETHSTTSSSLGLFSLQLGTGTPVTGQFSAIDWAGNSVFLEMEMDATGGTSYTSMGTAEMVSVPYALVAGNALNAMDSVAVTPRLIGNGSSTQPLDLAQQGAGNGQVLKWNGIAWGVANDDVDSIWEPDVFGAHLKDHYGSVGIGANSRPDLKVWVVDSTVNIMDGMASYKYHPNDSLYAFWAAHSGKGTGVGAAHYGTYGNALYVYSNDPSGSNTAPSARILNFSRGPGLQVQSTDPNSPAAGVLVQNGTQNYALHAQQITSGNGAALLQSVSMSNTTPTLRVENMGMGGTAFFTTAPSCTQTGVLMSQNGGTGRSLEVALGNSANTSNALHVVNEGRGMGISLQNLNSSSPQPAFSVNNSSTAGAINATHNNPAGTAVNVIAVNTTNPVPAMRVQNNGTNDAGYFVISNTTNAEVAVHGETNGTGSAGFFQVINSTYLGSALEATCNGFSASRAANIVNSGAGISLYASKPAGTTLGRAGHFQNFSTSNIDDGVLIQTNATSTSVYALHTNATGGGEGILISGGGDVGGDFDISGLLSKGGGSFKIDHPLDPENKYLYHSFVESPDMMNLYNGIAVLDAQGRAVVQLPGWFETLNSEFRYQLTCIGGHAAVYIASKVRGNQFEIAGGTPGLEVSWEVTGIRRDPFAVQNRIQVEVEKPASEKGMYLHPEAYGQAKEKGLMWQLQQAHGAGE